MIKNSTLLPPPAKLILPVEEDENAELSIYYKTTPVTPKQSHRSWSRSDVETPPRERFVHPKTSLDQSVLNETVADPNRNPLTLS
ncbi:hypothetical protein M5D96_010115 [Drosophila gunungcola]|uniref:Uncharacterized protein n=1 Tax=Drosophila gunungcola TaxID=103775 RepID=A0A9P9YIR9_9MUSC|nr:hypothetical protein M5D96_010115 [Drosophila gunungcola]